MDADRVEFLFGADVSGFDLADEADRIELVEQFAALPPDAPHRQSRMASRSVIVSQILDDDPPATWQAARRLRDSGLDRDGVLSQISLVMGEHLAAALGAGTVFDTEAFAEALDALPMPTIDEIARRLLETARSQRGITAGDHVDAVVADFGGSAALEMMVDRILDDLIEGPLLWLPNDQTAVVPDLVDGTTFTHRLTDEEAGLGLLTAGFDLGAFGRFDIVELDDGSDVRLLFTDLHPIRWSGTEGWLDRFQPGDLLSCTASVVPSDDLATGPIKAIMSIGVEANEPEISPAILDLVRAGYDDLVAEPGLPVGGDDLSWWLLFHHPGLFATAQPPLDELCASAGLERRGGFVAHDESVWRSALFAQRFNHVLDVVAEPHWRRIIGNALRVLDDPDATIDSVREALDDCAEPEALDALADVLFGHYLELEDEFDRSGADAPGLLFDLVNRATAVAKRPRERATAEYLAAVLYERCAAPVRAEAHLVRAAEAQPRLGPIVERLGWYHFDRGDARGAMRWWRTLSVLRAAAATIEPFLTPVAGRQKLGRNDPCWCGSGQKFKRCHQNATELPALPDRVGWLCRKALTWLEHSTGDVRATVLEMAVARATGDPDLGGDLASFGESAGMERLEDAFDDPIVFDAALHEAGLFGLFLYERGALLPEDEQLLAASWKTVERSVHEVVALDLDVGLTLRDLATGEVVDVRERSLSANAAVGERWCARVVPDGASNQIIGGVFPVRAGHETTVLDLCASHDPHALCAWVGGLAQPPRLVRTPGMIDDLIDRDAIDRVMQDLGDTIGQTEGIAALQVELQRQVQSRWLDESVPALGNLTPREAAADPTRREQLERLLVEMAPGAPPAELPEGFTPFTYDVAAIRRELGMD